MVKLTGLYGQPEDPAAFEDYCANAHVPLANRIPNVERFEAGTAAAAGSESPYQRSAELWFESKEVLEQTLDSDDGQAATGDIPNFATGGATIFISEVG